MRNGRQSQDGTSRTLHLESFSSAVSLMMIKMDNFILDRPRGLTDTCYAHTQQTNKQVKSNARRGEAPDSRHISLHLRLQFLIVSVFASLPNSALTLTQLHWGEGQVVNHKCRPCELQSSLLRMEWFQLRSAPSLRRTKGRVRPIDRCQHAKAL